MDNNMTKDLEWQNERNIDFWNFFSHFIYPFGLVLLMLVAGYIAFYYHILFGSILICIVGFFIYKVFYYYFNLKAMLLTNKGLELHTRFSGGIVSYPYGTFTIKKNVERGTYGISASDIITIASTHQRGIMFYSPVQYLGIDKSSAILSKHTQQALESIPIQDIAEIYLLYQDNIEYIFNEIRNHNVFTIDFSPYKESLKKLFAKEIQETLSHLSIQEQAKIYQSYQKACRHKSGLSLEYDLSYFDPYKAEIESYLKDKNE